MRVNVDFATFIDEIEFEPFLGENVDIYKKKFEEWYFTQNIENGIPIYPNQIKYKYFDAKPLVDWLNEVKPNCKARINKKEIEPGKEDKKLPYIYF